MLANTQPETPLAPHTTEVRCVVCFYGVYTNPAHILFAANCVCWMDGWMDDTNLLLLPLSPRASAKSAEQRVDVHCVPCTLSTGLKHCKHSPSYC